MKIISRSFDIFKIVVIFALMICGLKSHSQSLQSNYLLTETMLDADSIRSIRSIQYYDGMGRAVQSVSNGISGSGANVHQYTVYDLSGLKTKEYIPFVHGRNWLMTESLAQTYSSYRHNDSYCYTSTSYDAMGRVVGQTLPGSDWHEGGHTTTKNYLTNGSSEVLRYSAPCNNDYSLQKNGYYPAGSLYVEETTDEDGRILRTYKDSYDRVILERRTDGASKNDTYYVYNDLGQLRFVLSPEYQSAGYKSKYAYEYRYDSRGNVVKKLLPGCEYMQYWYDAADRLTFMQDGVLRSVGKYRFFLHDKYGRLCVQGICSQCQRSFTGSRRLPTLTYSQGSIGLMGTDYMLSVADLLTSPEIEAVKYYDDFSFLSGSMSQQFRGATGSEVNSTGFVTGSIERSSRGEYVSSVMHYDVEGRVVEVQRNMPGGRQELTSTQYTFTGNPQYITNTYKPAVPGEVLREFSLSNRYNQYNDRLETTSVGISYSNNNMQMYQATSRQTADISYDDYGRISSVSHSLDSDNTIGTNNSYNLRGWLTGITSSNGFEEHLYYTDGAGTAQYGGNISSMSWKDSGSSLTRGYRFDYDYLSRLTSANYGEGSSLLNNTPHYSEKVIEYTPNGSVKRLQRWGLKQDGKYGKIDNLHLTHDGNFLTKVVDDALPIYRSGSFKFRDDDNSEDIEYTYNGNGYLTSDRNKGIARIDYDMNNHPVRIQFTNGNVTEYVYTISGEKLRTIYRTAVSNISVPMGTTHTLTHGETLSVDSTDYCFGGTLILRNGRLSRYLFDGGYCSFTRVPSIGNLQYATTFHYYQQDHLGNIREVINGNNGTVEQQTHYYPFGGIIADISTNQSMQPNKYNGKELDLMHGLNTYDYGARQYDPITITWNGMDPLCEKYRQFNPLAYCMDNPVKHVDKDGRRIVDTNGNTAIHYKNDQFVYTKYATTDIIKISNALQLTKSGANMLKQAVQSDIDIKMTISPESKLFYSRNMIGYTYGETIQGNYNARDNFGKYQRKDDTFGIKEAHVIIYEGTIKEGIKAKNTKHAGLTKEEALGAVAGHELVHATDKNEIHKDISYEIKHNGQPRDDKEHKANYVENCIINEYQIP